MSFSVFLFAALVRSTPLILVGLAVAIAFRAKLLNIGAEGQLLVGASAAVAVGLACSSWPGAVLVPAELIAGAVAGAVWAGIAAILKERFGVLEVISTLMLNFVAQNLVSYLVRGPMQEPTHVYPQTVALVSAARLPVLASGQRLHLGFVLAVVLAVALWWMLRSTATGFRIRAVGDGAAAAASAGRVRVSSVVLGVFLASGALAGLGGGVEASGVTYALYEGISPGYGYTAIAVALLARLNPLLVILAGIFFGALEAGAAAMQRNAGVPAMLVTAIEAVVILGMLAAGHARTIAAARAQPSAFVPTVEGA